MDDLASQSTQPEASAPSSPTSPDTDIDALLGKLNYLAGSDLTALYTYIYEPHILQQLRHTLLDHTNKKHACNAFRLNHGFQALLQLLLTISNCFKVSPVSADDKRVLFLLLRDGLAVLRAAFGGDGKNRIYFAKTVGGGGWHSLSRSLCPLQDVLCQDQSSADDVGQYLGILIATSLTEDTFYNFFSTLLTAFQESASDKDNVSVQTFLSGEGATILLKFLQSVDHIAVPALLSQSLNFWSLCCSNGSANHELLGFALARVLLQVVQVKQRHPIILRGVGLPQALLQCIFDTKHTDAERTVFQQLALSLFRTGIGSLNVAHALYQQADTSTEGVCFLLQALQVSRRPSSIDFDLSSHGYCSVELSSLRGRFPPTTTAGYTLTMWVMFHTLASEIHTTLFGTFDASQKCFVLAYLEKDTHHLILQTAIKGSKPSVRFKSVSFQSDRWYHICIIHRRPRSISPSKASLFVDGEFCEQIKTIYPASPPVDSASSTPRVQTFFGTPQNLAVRTKQSTSLSRWSLASSALFADAFSDDLISVFYHLGPRYYGNFQDCLGSFQTYAASAALNLRHENLHLGADEASDILSAVRKKASILIPESSVLVNLSPITVISETDCCVVDQSQRLLGLSDLAIQNLQRYTQAEGSAVLINGAVPSIDEALASAHGVAILTGDPVISVSDALDEAAWRLGGCTGIVLRLVHRATMTEDLARKVEVLFETVRQSWRNSEAMERDQGYTILANLLRGKFGASSHKSGSPAPYTPAIIPTPNMSRERLRTTLLRSVLEFIGYDFGRPERSIINNPLAYRALLVDTGIWRHGDSELQKLYYRQFVVFGMESHSYRFNARRLARMRVLKKLLDSLRTEPMLPDTMPLFEAAFKSLLPGALNAETLRSLALFITFSLYQPKTAMLSQDPRLQDVDSPFHPSTKPTLLDSSPVALTRSQIGVKVLQLYSGFLCNKEEASAIKKFARTVTNKWLLYLLADSSPEVIVLATKILARVLAVHGISYVKKFGEKSNGFVILRHRLRRWWHLPALWPICFAILFGLDIATLELDRPFNLSSLLELFGASELAIVNSSMFAVIGAMLQRGLASTATIVNGNIDGEQPSVEVLEFAQRAQTGTATTSAMNPKQATMTADPVATLHTVLHFLKNLHSKWGKFRDFTTDKDSIQTLYTVLFPVVVGSDVISADIELKSQISTIVSHENELLVQPLTVAPKIASQDQNANANGTYRRGSTLRRGSSYVVVPSVNTNHKASSSQPSERYNSLSIGKVAQVEDDNAVFQPLLELVAEIFIDQVIKRKDFPGLHLALTSPPALIKDRIYFESWTLRYILIRLNNSILVNSRILQEPKVITNLARVFSHVGEALYEGHFLGGAGPSLDLSGCILEYLQRSDVSSVKSVRLCSQAIETIRVFMFRTVIFGLAQIQDDDDNRLPFLTKLGFWQPVLLSDEDAHAEHLQLICYLLYASLVSRRDPVRMSAINLWRIILVQKPRQACSILKHAKSSEHLSLVSGFEKLVELDNETFMHWVDSHRKELDALFSDTLAGSWRAFVAEENSKTIDLTRHRMTKRQEKLSQWKRNELDEQDASRRHEVTFEHWTTNIHSSEVLKIQRSMQDQHDNSGYILARFESMRKAAEMPIGFKSTSGTLKWRLDQTEGRDRLRLRILPEIEDVENVAPPRRKSSNASDPTKEASASRASERELDRRVSANLVSFNSSPKALSGISELSSAVSLPTSDAEASQEKPDLDDSFELVDDPKGDAVEYEDKNRKVMRSLHRGDQVQHVANTSRIVGLEAIEGLLILGKDNLYLIDDFFQRADGEIVNVWQAPFGERDTYVRTVSGRAATARHAVVFSDAHKTRSWRWAEVISASKRRFLFRDVALEIFFGDGRSYLLTAMTNTIRDRLHGLIVSNAPQLARGGQALRSEDRRRLQILRSPEEEPRSLGSRFATVFGQPMTNSASRRWAKGELSNFHYLMLVNTMAGRTFNDLTQYPVFPWVLADYSSDDLDLTRADSYRDLSKPMGCQTRERETEYRERFSTLAEMADDDSPAFHYGTHYSSAMIVASYLIRLPPFIQSYLLLQGGTFDHADRMFYSIRKTWESASGTNMADVRELTPEFFYLPEFLVNLNGYDFGARQGSSQSVSSVELPPWAKGDPKIFIAKHREALESHYVSQNLHQWIDLVFGYKQKGEAAREAVNVFHHLSYQGSKDLDNISDPVERLATIGIIHNFGQTPHQVFHKAHPARGEVKHPYQRLDTAAESLTQLPPQALQGGKPIASLAFSWKQDRLLSSAAFRLHIPPIYDKFAEWGFTDRSLRFYSADGGKLLGLLENLHEGQILTATFADSRTLVTAGVDCVVSVWTLLVSANNVDLQLRSSLFGHRASVHTLALSRSFSALLSASTDGRIILWDLNRLEFVRVLRRECRVQCAKISDVNGNVVICHTRFIAMFTLNGELILEQAAGPSDYEDRILCCAFYEGAGDEWLEREILFTGHPRGVVRVWHKTTRGCGFELELIRQLNHADHHDTDGFNAQTGISCILPMSQIVYTGDEAGRVVSHNSDNFFPPFCLSVSCG